MLRFFAPRLSIFLPQDPKLWTKCSLKREIRHEEVALEDLKEIIVLLIGFALITLLIFGGLYLLLKIIGVL